MYEVPQRNGYDERDGCKMKNFESGSSSKCGIVGSDGGQIKICAKRAPKTASLILL